MNGHRIPCEEKALLLADAWKRSTMTCEGCRVSAGFPFHHQHTGDHQAYADILLPGEGHPFLAQPAEGVDQGCDGQLCKQNGGDRDSG